MTHTSDTPASFLRTPLFFWVVLIVAILWFLGAVSAILLPFVLGMIVAYCFDPLADRLERAGFSRAGATSLITVIFFTVFAGVLIWLLPLLAKQLMGLIALLPQAFATLEQLVRAQLQNASDVFGTDLKSVASHDSVKESVAGISKSVLGTGAVLVKNIISSGGAFLNIMSLLFITPIVSFYALRDWDEMVARIDDLMPRAQVETIREQCNAIDKTLAGFLRGQINVILILAVYYCATLSMIGVPFGLVIGVITALLVIVPYVGTLISMVVAISAALVHAGVGAELYWVLAVYAFGQVLEQQFLTPRIVGKEVGLPPLWMLFAMLSGATLFGFVGMLIAVPAAAVLGVLVRFAVLRYRASAYYHGWKPPIEL